jgi:Xaa-Pro aminopeptidase
MSYFYLTFHDATLYVDKKSLNAEVKKHLEKNQITVKGYEDIYKDLKHVKEKNVLLDPAIVNAALISAFPKKVSFVEDANPTELMKAIKNEVEQENTRLAHIKDGVAVTKFIYWLKQNIGKTEITEVSAAEKLLEFREAQEHFIDVSFDTIAAYGFHGAIVHYEATPETDIPLEPKGLLLLDSGAQYQDGTTDITRTIALGELTDEQRHIYTLVLKGHIQLELCKFPAGASGTQMDILARMDMWREGFNYLHGTGHGVGYLLSIHETSARISWQGLNEAAWKLEHGMVVTNEPGIYVQDSHGIRLENELLVRRDVENEYGQFMYFEVLTYVPFDLDAIVTSLLREDEKSQLNAYHKLVFDTVSPYLNDDERTWLKIYTRAI